MCVNVCTHLCMGLWACAFQWRGNTGCYLFMYHSWCYKISWWLFPLAYTLFLKNLVLHWESLSSSCSAFRVRLCLCLNDELKVIPVKSEVKVSQSCPTLCDLMDYSLPASSVSGILQTSILEWVIVLFSRGSSQPRDWTQVSCIAGRLFTIWATKEALVSSKME